MGRVTAELAANRHDSATDAVVAVLAVTTTLFRTEPGYRSIRIGDVLDLLPPQTDSTGNALMADVVTDALVAGYGVADSVATRLTIGTAIEIADALVARAFARSSHGDASLLAEAERAVRAVLADRL